MACGELGESALQRTELRRLNEMIGEKPLPALRSRPAACVLLARYFLAGAAHLKAFSSSLLPSPAYTAS